jgi:hypothetical protein
MCYPITTAFCPINWLAAHEPDTDATAYSAPVFSGTGNGTCAITLLTNANTEGFAATYDLANEKWTLSGTGGASVSDQKTGGVPLGTMWTNTIGTTISVLVTQGSTAFADGDTFVFSVFKTTATGGKVNETDSGAYDVTDGP